MKRSLRWRSGRWLGALFAATMFVSPASASDKIKVVATFSILGDLVRNIGGSHVEVTTLVGPNGDPHVFEPSPADASRITDAKIIVVNGLGLEGWLNRLITVSERQAVLVVATQGIKPRMRGVEREQNDPHAWQSVPNVEVYAANIRDGLIAADPADKADYEANFAAYDARLIELDRDIRQTVADIPQDRRTVLTVHSGFGYFSDAYGIAFVGLQGVSTEAEPSARDVAAIVRQIKENRIAAVFVENIVNPALLKRVAEETGARIGGTLYSDALTDAGGDAPSYIDLMRHNLRTLNAALKD
jgi:zinc/manganese transport system substrate-binding protein